MIELFKRVRLPLAMITVVAILGTMGYRVAGMPWLDAMYQTVITVTTVGFADEAQRFEIRWFTILMAVLGPVTLTVMISIVTGTVIESQLRDLLGRRKVENMVSRLEKHIIVCGYGRFGRTIASELERKGTPYVILEHDPAKAENAREHKLLLLEVDATEEESLEQAGLARSRGLMTTLGSDAANVYVTLTAKQLRPDLHVVAIAQDERSRAKLLAAGADEVVLPYVIGGNWMVQAILSPAVADFVRMATGANPLNFYMEEQRVAASSSLAGHALMELPIRRELGVIVVAVRRADGSLVTNPPPDFEVGPDDTLVSVGQQENLARLKEMAQPRG